MKTRDRREREFRRREAEFLDLARRLIVEQGYPGFNMDRLADATDYSKGTVYQHFSSKEDLMSALAAQSMVRRVELFDKALAFDGTTRERMAAVGVAEELFFRLHPLYYRSELVIKFASLESRVSAERTAELGRLEQTCFTGLLGLTEQASAAGDLKLPAPLQPADVCLGFWGLATGMYGAVQGYAPMLAAFGVADPVAGFRRMFECMLDGLGWKPLTTEWDWAASYRRIETGVFAEEVRQASPHN